MTDIIFWALLYVSMGIMFAGYVMVKTRLYGWVWVTAVSALMFWPAAMGFYFILCLDMVFRRMTRL